MLSEFSRYIRLVRPPEHLSMRANFAFAAAQARGTWLAFIGSDDRVRADYVERINKGLQNGRLLPGVISSLLMGREIAASEGRQVRDFIYVRDDGNSP